MAGAGAGLPDRIGRGVLDHPANRHLARSGAMTRSAMKRGATNLKTSKIVLPLLLLWPTGASAHILGDQAGGFISGFEHPISGLDHIVAMVSVGLWGAQLGPPAIWLLPVTFS